LAAARLALAALKILMILDAGSLINKGASFLSVAYIARAL